MPIKNQKFLLDIRRLLSYVEMKVDDLAREEAKVGTEYHLHKALNVLFKELDCAKTLVAVMTGELKEDALAHSDVQEPQSWKVYKAKE